MKTKIPLGCLDIEFEVEGNDYQELIRQSWIITRLNQAIIQEGGNIREWLPYAETNPSDGFEYAGFVHLGTGQRIRFGKQKDGTGGEWFVRIKGQNKHYRGVESFGPAPPTDNILPPAQNKSKPAELDPNSRIAQAQANAITNLVARLEKIEPADVDVLLTTEYVVAAGFFDMDSLSAADAGEVIRYLNKELTK